MKKTGMRAAFVIMAVVMLFAVTLLHAEPAQATSGDPGMVVGLPGDYLQHNYADNGAQVVWFGQDAWYVIGYGADVFGNWQGEGTVTLLSKELLFQTPFATNSGHNAYAQSTLKQKLDNYYQTTFSSQEIAQIVTEYLEGGNKNYGVGTGYKAQTMRGPDLPNAYLWPLSEAEVWNLHGETKLVPWLGEDAESGYWWLRSPGTTDEYAQYVRNGSPLHQNVGHVRNDSFGARPAFHLSMDQIAFLSAAGAGDASGSGNGMINKVSSNPGNEWRVTLKDSTRSGFKVDSAAAQGSAIVNIRYSGAKTGTNEYISAAIIDDSGVVKYYGRLAAASSASGTVTIKNYPGMDTEGGEHLYLFNEQYNGYNKTGYTSELQEVPANVLTSEGSLTGTGTADDPYLINGVFDWNAFAARVNGGDSMAGKYVRLNADIRVSKMVGTGYGYEFSGIFEGAGHTLVFNRIIDSMMCAPFGYVKGAAIRDLHTEGTIRTSRKNAAGIVASATAGADRVRITNCRSSVVIISSLEGEGNYGGLVSSGTAVIFEGCCFDGSIIAPNAYACGGFLGWDGTIEVPCRNCVFDAATINTKSRTANFTPTSGWHMNCYYTKAIGQGADWGKQMRSVTTEEGTTIRFGEGTEYNVSGITAYDIGLEYKGVFYAGASEEIALTAADADAAYREYMASAGSLSGTGTDYQLLMPDENVVISSRLTRLYEPQNVRIELNTEASGLLAPEQAVTATWDPVANADGYLLTVYQIEKGGKRQLGAAIDVEDSVSYDLTRVIYDQPSSGSGKYSFTVQAYADDLNPSTAVSSVAVEIYPLTLNFKNVGVVSGLYMRKGADVGGCIHEWFVTRGDYYHYIDDEGHFFIRGYGDQPFEIELFTDKPLQEYASLAALEQGTIYAPEVLRDPEHEYPPVVATGPVTAYAVLDWELEDFWARNVEVNLADAEITLSEKTFTYNTQMQQPNIYAESAEGISLYPGTDFTVKCSEPWPRDAGTYTITLTGIGRCKGTAKLTYTIKPKAVKPVVSMAKKEYSFTGKAQKPAVIVKDGDTRLEAKDYTVTYASGLTNVGTYKVTVKLKGNYSGTGTTSFKIVPAKIALPKAKSGLIYNGAKQTGVAAGTAYTVTGGAQTKAGTYTAKAALKDTKNYTWSDGKTTAKSIKWTIGKANVKSANIAAIKEQAFTGAALKPAPVVKMTLNKKSVTLKAGTDYKVTYKNNTVPGTATVTITGIGNFTGTKSVSFKIVKPKTTMVRLSGDNRYATSQAIADAYKQALGVKQFDAVCVADGTNYPDALAGSFLAALKKAPIISIDKNNPAAANTQGALAYIKKNLKPKGTVYLLGGTGSVPQVLEKTLQGYGFTVKRVWGPNRYTSNLAILQEAKVAAGSEIIVCTGADFADALSASATGKPVLLVGGNALLAEQKAYLQAARAGRFTIIGDQTVVPATIEAELKAFAPVSRITGKTTYERSVAIARKYFPGVQAHINIADGKNFPDALCGGPMAVLSGGSLLLVDDQSAILDPVLAYVKAARTYQVTVYGGPGSVSEVLVNKILSVN
ncbi:MAG: cell wall-binding repeat-containing protein [Firmicutes bacterium]|nr:cell wall-binding repeat-containing protein [Bacillota bacterium]